MSAVAALPHDRLAPLRVFVDRIGVLLHRTGDEPALLAEGAGYLAALIADDGWLPATHAAPDPAHYRQYLLYRDPAARFSLVSFVWGPGQSTPVHDHTVWGLVGVLRGAEITERYTRQDGGLRSLGSDLLEVGAIDAVSPFVGDLHRVSNAYADAVSISIHLYGADIGVVRRSTYDADGAVKPFVSGYADAPALL